MTKKKKILLAVSSVFLIALLAGVLIAYFAAKKDEPNLITVGENKISVTEAFTPPKQEDEFKYRKLVKIENTGSVPCYIRVRVEFSNSAVQKAASFSAANQGENDSAPDDESFKSAEIATGSGYYINDLPDGWVYVWEGNANSYVPVVTNGYYYYTEPVDPEKTTSALISWVKMNYNDADIQAHDLYIYSESVQTVNPNTGLSYTDWKDAWHSFAE